ncbi:MAG TPA: response regulator [Pyrinomonadaceae bacterium]|jgi:DNA-binding response OmpR family regulator|nr:response regulator [Pyrinomonadaceae bacterium]
MSTTIDAAPRRILVADDDPVVRQLVSSVVRREGYTPVVAEDGREAVRILQSDAGFGAAVFDMKMPHLEGTDIIRHMRTEKRLMRIPVILMTSETALELMKDGFEAGATVFLPKPFMTMQLQSLLRLLLGKNGKAAKPSYAAR